MKTKTLITGILFAVVALASAATNDLTSTLQRGLFEEEANHNLDAAAQAYQTVSTQFDKDRKLAATAIFRLGEVYRKQGKTNEATAQYERIVREFADQSTLVTLSRQNLAGLGEKKVAPASSPLMRAARLKQTKLLEEEIQLVEQDLAELKKRVEAGVVPQTEVRAKEREVLKLRQQVAALNVDEESGLDWDATKLRKEIATTERELEFFERNKKEDHKGFPSLLASKDDELKNLFFVRGEKERRLAALKQNYTTEHPEVKAVQAELDSTTKAINDRAEGILIGDRNRLEGLRTALTELERKPEQSPGLRPPGSRQ